MHPHAPELKVDDTLGSVVWGVSVEIVNFFHKECRFGTFLEEMYLYPVVFLAWSITRSLNVPIIIRVLTTLPCTHGSYIKFIFGAFTFQAPYKKYYGHSAHVTNVRFTFDDQYLLSAGGDDSWWEFQYYPPHTRVFSLIPRPSPLPVLLIVWVTPSNWSLTVSLPIIILFSLAFSFGSVSDYRNRPYNDVILMWYPEIPIVEVSNFWF